MAFDGFPEAALDFYDDLEVDNSKAFWDAHRETYETAVRAPMLELTAALEDEFGSAKLFRPYRDVRFSKDKTPYKTHQGAFVKVAESTGYYVQVSAPGIRTGFGFYRAEPARLAAFRRSVADDVSGPRLEKLLKALERKGFEVSGDQLATAPRGFDKTHPRIDLLRHKSLAVGRDHGFAPYVHTSELLAKVRQDWRAGGPLLDWLDSHVQE